MGDSGAVRTGWPGKQKTALPAVAGRTVFEGAGPCGPALEDQPRPWRMKRWMWSSITASEYGLPSSTSTPASAALVW